MKNTLQEKILEMMKWFHKFCIENSINYYMIGGTMLGAIRHKGFIPWDDDMDLGIPRNDFLRLISLKSALNKSNSKYILESLYDENNDFEYPYAKLYNKATILVENNRKRTKRGLYIELFPLDGIGHNYKGHFRK